MSLKFWLVIAALFYGGQAAAVCSSESSYKECSDQTLCAIATENVGSTLTNARQIVFYLGGRNWNWVKEARKRGLTCEASNVLAVDKLLKAFPLRIEFNKLRKDYRLKIQSNLKELGLYTSSVDGLYGNGTAAALTAYNKKYLGASDLKVSENVTKLLKKVLALAIPKPITESEAELFIKIKEDFGLNYYGGFIHTDRLPNTLLFFSDIRKNDSFEFRKALRVHDIELIVLSSPGGSVFEGLQTAGIIHDKNLKTYIPNQSLYGSGDCASACSFMFFAGESRSAKGDLGVHQFYSGKASDKAEIGSTQKTAQFTVSEIIGFLNEFETPAWVYERMFQQSEMYYFTESELLQLETEVSDETKAQHEKADKFISDFRSAFVKIKD